MTRYRTKSAEVLNNADRFEDILNWTLFAEEQDTRLWNGPDWRPGDRLVARRPVWANDDLYQLIEPRDAVWVGDLERRFYARCDACNVSWVGDEPCWSCGADRPEEAKVVSQSGYGFEALLQAFYAVDEGVVTHFQHEPEIVEDVTFDHEAIGYWTELTVPRGIRLSAIVIDEA